MELYAAGCNAWAQLEFDASAQPNLNDVSKFTKIASGSTIEVPISRLVYTLVKVDGEFLIAGHMLDHTLAPHATVIAMRANGDSLRRERNQPYLTMSKNNNGKVTTESFYVQQPVKQVAAFDTGFAILYEDGTVATMGDPRFPASLGRIVTKDEPAESFAQLVDLIQLEDPVKHITACGYAVAALTESGSVYIWGRHPPSRKKEQPFFPELFPFANYIEIAGGKDIADFALGETHAIALTTEGELYVIGNNENGQLGIPSLKETRGWTRLEFYPPEGSLVTRVTAGPHTSFILVSANPVD